MNNNILGFMGVSKDILEMLLLHAINHLNNY